MKLPGAGLALTLLALSGSVPEAQTVRVSGSTSLRYIELRGFTSDSVLADVAVGNDLLRQLPDGSVVRCIPGEAYCYQVRAGPVLSTVPVIHDLDVSAWGFGRGLRLTSQLRGRTSFGSSTAAWPREREHLEVLSLYGDLERGALRVRAGRQWRVSGLGFYNFDGLAVGVRPGPVPQLTSQLLDADLIVRMTDGSHTIITVYPHMCVCRKECVRGPLLFHTPSACV
jgi:hypothetical protein